MDRIISRDIIKQFIKKYAYILLVLVTGIFLMVLPEPESTEQQSLQIKLEEESLEESLENIRREEMWFKAAMNGTETDIAMMAELICEDPNRFYCDWDHRKLVNCGKS